MRVVFVADLHVGSRVGLSTGHGDDAFLLIRKKILNLWETSVAGPWKKPDILVVVGDAIDGQNKKGGGTGTTTTDLIEQADEAVELIKMWNAGEYVIIRGSDYHVSPRDSGLAAEEYMARELNAMQCPNNKVNRSSWSYYLSVDKYTFHIAHKISIPRNFAFKSTAIARDMMMAKLNDSLRNELGKYKVNAIIRAHAHSFTAVEYASSCGMVLPCWKAMDDYAEKEGPLTFTPDIGFVGWNIEGDKATWEKNLVKVTSVQDPPHLIVKGGK